MHLETTKVPLRDASGKVTGLVGIGRDITQRVEAARALDGAVRESQEIIQAVLTGASDRRIAMQGKTGNLLLLAQSINELIDSVSNTVAETVRVVGLAVEGDLTSRMNVDDKSGDFKALGASVNSMIQAMRDVVAGLTRTCRAVQSGAEEISRGNLDLSKRTEEQASSLVETTSSMEQMTSRVRNNAENAMQANQLAVAAREQAERGGSVVGSAVAAMSEISAASNKIAEIIGVIDEIAFQTNLLALNAAVEAARAGEQGRGFAVVAAEVRNLASRSAGAAKEIKALIQDSVGKVNEGTKLVDESGQVLGEIVTRVKKVTDVMAEIADSSREQASGIEQVNRAVSSMDASTQQNAALVEAGRRRRARAERAGDQHDGSDWPLSTRPTGSGRHSASPASSPGFRCSPWLIMAQPQGRRGVDMLLYVLYACMHFTGKHAPQFGQTHCVESEIFFRAEECRKELPQRPDKPQKIAGGVNWLECDTTPAASWIPAEASDAGNHVYKAQASSSDASAMAALLAPLTPEARAALGSGNLKGRFERTFQGPGSLAFFIVGTGSSVTAYAVTNLDDFQFSDMATDVSSAAAAMAATKEDLDLSSSAENAGVELSYHTEMSRRALPPPGGMLSAPSVPPAPAH